MKNARQASMIMSTSSGFFMWGIIASLASLVSTWPFVQNQPPGLELLVFLVGPISILSGNLVMGFLSDIFGRKPIFLSTLVSYGIGIIVVAFSNTLSVLLLGLILAQFGAGGEEPSSLSLISEDVPAEKRGKMITLILNTNNIGSAFIAGLFILITVEHVFQQRIALAISAAAILAIIIFSRLSMPESYRWLKSKGRLDESEKERIALSLTDDAKRIKYPGFLKSYIVLGIMGISQYLTFGLMAYIIGPFEFSKNTSDMIVFFGMIGSSVAGFIAAPLISRGRKSYTLFAFGGGLVTIIIIFMLSSRLGNLTIFLPLLFLNMMFSEFAWASRTSLEPELFPTRIRSRVIGLIRLMPMIAYVLSIIYLSNLNISQFVAFNVGLWLLGFAAAVYWFIAGVETKDISADFEENINA